MCRVGECCFFSQTIEDELHTLNEFRKEKISSGFICGKFSNFSKVKHDSPSASCW